MDIGDLPAFSSITNNRKFESRICYLRELLKRVKINILHLFLSHSELVLNINEMFLGFSRELNYSLLGSGAANLGVLTSLWPSVLEAILFGLLKYFFSSSD